MLAHVKTVNFFCSGSHVFGMQIPQMPHVSTHQIIRFICGGKRIMILHSKLEQCIFNQYVLMFRVLCTIKLNISLLLQYNYGKGTFSPIYSSEYTFSLIMNDMRTKQFLTNEFDPFVLDFVIRA